MSTTFKTGKGSIEAEAGQLSGDVELVSYREKHVGKLSPIKNLKGNKDGLDGELTKSVETEQVGRRASKRGKQSDSMIIINQEDDARVSTGMNDDPMDTQGDTTLIDDNLPETAVAPNME